MNMQQMKESLEALQKQVKELEARMNAQEEKRGKKKEKDIPEIA